MPTEQKSSLQRTKKGFPDGAAGQESSCNAGDTKDVGLIPGLGRSPIGGNSNSLHYSCLGYPMDRGAWWATVQRVAKSWTCLKQLGMHAPAMGVVCVSEAVDISPGLIPACDSSVLAFCIMHSA